MPELEALRQRAREIDGQIAARRQEIEEIEREKEQVQQQVKQRLLETADRFGLLVTFEPPRLRRRNPAAVRSLGIELTSESASEQSPSAKATGDMAAESNTDTEGAAGVEERA